MTPPFEIKETKDIKLSRIQEGEYRYEAKLIASSGTQDALLTCRLVWVDGQWKIAEAGYKLI